MLSEKELKGLSKFLSFVLRHRPQEIDLLLDNNGWANVDDLIEKLKAKGFAVDHHLLQSLVANNNKKRFAFNDDGTKLRASQGHSIDVELGYRESIPPLILYHGTAEKNSNSILQQGLLKQDRQHVHLTVDQQTAITVGGRHGKPIVLEVQAAQMHADGHSFFLSANGVWLTHSVPAIYLKLL